jgi:hypothetical protein
MVYISDVSKHVAVSRAREERKAVRIQMDPTSTWHHGSGLESSAQVSDKLVQSLRFKRQWMVTMMMLT